MLARVLAVTAVFLHNTLHQSQRRHVTSGHTRFLQIFTKLSITNSHIQCYKFYNGRSQLPRGLRRGNVADGLLGFRARTPPGLGSLSLESGVYWEIDLPASG